MTLAIVLSGAAGLIFQIVWLYECSLAFGSSLVSATIVLSSFMSGLALGNALVAWADRKIASHLRAYAALELTVAASGIALSYALPHATGIVTAIAGAAGARGAFHSALELAAAFTLLVIPTTAMGATLAMLVGALVRRADAFGAVLGRVYGWNTAGAVAGVILAETVFVRVAGVKGAAWVGGLLDVVAAAIALWTARRSSEPAAAESRTTGSPPTSNVAIALLLGAAAISGAILLALEVVWFRFLTMYVLSTTLAVSLMLAVVLAAIAAGGLIASVWLHRRASGFAVVPAVALLAGCATTLAYGAFGVMTSGTQIGEWYRVLWLACALVVPTSLLSGVLFTLLGSSLARMLPEGSGTRPTALLTLANTLGAACGPPLATFVLLPGAGMEGAFFALSFAYVAVAVLAFAPTTSRPQPSRAPARHRRPGAAFNGAAALAFTAAMVVFPFGAMQARYFPRSAAAYADDGSTIVATREGPSDTVFLMQQTWLGQPVYSRLVTNGFSMSGTAVPGMRYMRAFAYWPLFLHDGPIKRALLVCYGVGMTAQAVEDIPSLESMDVVEISKDVVAMSDVLYAGQKAPLRDARVRLHIEDGRHYLQTAGERFDLITGEPPPPRTPGTVNIYTREYFQLLYDHLEDGGVATYWLPVARPNPGTDVDTILRAFCDVFHDCTLWNATPFDLMLVGSRNAHGRIDHANFRTPWVTPGLEAHLREVGYETPEEIGATFVGDAAYLATLVRGTPPLVDDFPQRLVPSPSRPSLSDPRYASDGAIAERFQQVIDPVRAGALFLSSPEIAERWPPALRESTKASFDVQRIVNRVLWEGGKPLRQIEDLHFVLTSTRLRTLPLWMLGSDEVKQRIAEQSADVSGAVEYARALRALSVRGYAAAATFLAAAEQRGMRNAQVSALHAYALAMDHRPSDALAIAEGANASDADERHFWEWIRTRIASGDFAN
jgi:spermidine synthase